VAPDVWAGLKHRTGWVILGVVAESGRWETQIDFKSVAADAAHAEHPSLSLGHMIRLTGPHSLYIAGYGKAKDESKRFVVPAPEGRVNDSDETGLDLPADSEVRLDALVKAPGLGSKWVVWARVSPTP
jgi:hypothetical protein